MLREHIAAVRLRDELVGKAQRLLEEGKVRQADKALSEAERLTEELKRLEGIARGKWKWPGPR